MNYKEATEYARTFSPRYYLDVVHDAFLSCFEDRKLDLFTQPVDTVKDYINKAYKNNPTKNLVLLREGDAFCEPEEPFDDLLSRFEKCEQHTHLELFKLAVGGWAKKDVALLTNESQQFIDFYFEKMGYPQTLFN